MKHWQRKIYHFNIANRLRHLLLHKVSSYKDDSIVWWLTMDGNDNYMPVQDFLTREGKK